MGIGLRRLGYSTWHEQQLWSVDRVTSIARLSRSSAAALHVDMCMYKVESLGTLAAQRWAVHWLTKKPCTLARARPRQYSFSCWGIEFFFVRSFLVPSWHSLSRLALH